MNLKLKDLRIGKVDGRDEYLTPVNERDHNIFEGFMIPDNIDPDRMHNSDIYFIEGFRGTGKTSLLRWHAEKKRKDGSVTDFILFKTDLTETKRMQISKEVGISWTDVDSSKMAVSQDFKAAWDWFIVHKIGENIKNDNYLIDKLSMDAFVKVEKLLGLSDANIFKKALGFMPKLEGASVKISAEVGFFELELGGDFRKDGSNGSVTLEALTSKIIDYIKNIKFKKTLFLYFDETGSLLS